MPERPHNDPPTDSLTTMSEAVASPRGGKAGHADVCFRHRFIGAGVIREHQEPCGKCAEAGVFAFFLNGQFERIPKPTSTGAWSMNRSA